MPVTIGYWKSRGVSYQQDCLVAICFSQEKIYLQTIVKKGVGLVNLSPRIRTISSCSWHSPFDFSWSTCTGTEFEDVQYVLGDGMKGLLRRTNSGVEGGGGGFLPHHQSLLPCLIRELTITAAELVNAWLCPQSAHVIITYLISLSFIRTRVLQGGMEICARYTWSWLSQRMILPMISILAMLWLTVVVNNRPDCLWGLGVIYMMEFS